MAAPSMRKEKTREVFRAASALAWRRTTSEVFYSMKLLRGGLPNFTRRWSQIVAIAVVMFAAANGSEAAESTQVADEFLFSAEGRATPVVVDGEDKSVARAAGDLVSDVE